VSTPGAEFRTASDHAQAGAAQGYHAAIDLPAFFENDRKTPTGLGGYLRERG
jgi:nicotinamidase/pyrazinamidase